MMISIVRKREFAHDLNHTFLLTCICPEFLVKLAGALGNAAFCVIIPGMFWRIDLMKEMIRTDKLVFEYIRRDEEGNVEGITRAVDDVNLRVKPGQFIAILGHNGSGKSTLAKHFNALLYPTEGEVYVDGMNTEDGEHLWDVRQEAGMICQNPDNQIIGQIFEEDV
jgi:ABC-type multidrug transport system fused ATPase/permease subunit